MENSSVTTERPATGQIVRLIAGPGLFIAIVALVGIWLGWNYAGLMHWLGELEFRLFDRWHPAITVLSLAAIPALIWRAIVWLRRRKRRAAGQEESAPAIRARTLLYLRALQLLLLAASGVALALALAAFVQFVSLPDTDAPPRPLNIERIEAFKEGPVLLQGLRTIGPLSRYEEGLFGIGPDYWFVPVVSRHTALGPEYTLFAEVEGRRDALLGAEHAGILRHDALPRELIVLYRANGMRVSDTASVVYLDRRSMQRGTLFFLFETLLAAVIALIFAAYARQRIRRLREE
jgi:hypothetical protein